MLSYQENDKKDIKLKKSVQFMYSRLLLIILDVSNKNKNGFNIFSNGIGIWMKCPTLHHHWCFQQYCSLPVDPPNSSISQLAPANIKPGRLSFAINIYMCSLCEEFEYIKQIYMSNHFISRILDCLSQPFVSRYRSRQKVGIKQSRILSIKWFDM